MVVDSDPDLNLQWPVRKIWQGFFYEIYLLSISLCHSNTLIVLKVPHEFWGLNLKYTVTRCRYEMVIHFSGVLMERR